MSAFVDGLVEFTTLEYKRLWAPISKNVRKSMRCNKFQHALAAWIASNMEAELFKSNLYSLSGELFADKPSFMAKLIEFQKEFARWAWQNPMAVYANFDKEFTLDSVFPNVLRTMAAALVPPMQSASTLDLSELTFHRRYAF